MREIEVYEPLANWMQTKYGFEWKEITHENPCIVFNESEETAEVDICLGKNKNGKLDLTDVIHVKTKDNLQGKNERYELLGKAKLTLEGIQNVWIAIEQSTLSLLKGGIDDKIGIITYQETNDTAMGFTIKKEPDRDDTPRFYQDTQNLFNKKFGKLIETSHSVFLCSMNEDNWNICIKNRLWGVPKGATAAESAIRRAKPGDILLFRLNGGIDFVATWMVTSKPFEDHNGGPWKKENPQEKRDFVWQVKMHPMLVDTFEKPVKLEYKNGINKETGITTKSFMSGMVGITDTQYKIISKKLIDANLSQLQ